MLKDISKEFDTVTANHNLLQDTITPPNKFLSKNQREKLFNEAEKLRLNGHKNESANLFMKCLAQLEVKTAFPSLPKCLRALANHFLEKEEFIKSIHFVQAERLYYESALIDTAALQQKLSEMTTMKTVKSDSSKYGNEMSRDWLSIDKIKIEEYEQLIKFHLSKKNLYAALDYAQKNLQLCIKLYSAEDVKSKEALCIVHDIEVDIKKTKAFAEKINPPNKKKTDKKAVFINDNEELEKVAQIEMPKEHLTRNPTEVSFDYPKPDVSSTSREWKWPESTVNEESKDFPVEDSVHETQLTKPIIKRIPSVEKIVEISVDKVKEMPKSETMFNSWRYRSFLGFTTKQMINSDENVPVPKESKLIDYQPIKTHSSPLLTKRSTSEPSMIVINRVVSTIKETFAWSILNAADHIQAFCNFIFPIAYWCFWFSLIWTFFYIIYAIIASILFPSYIDDIDKMFQPPSLLMNMFNSLFNTVKELNNWITNWFLDQSNPSSSINNWIT